MIPTSAEILQAAVDAYREVTNRSNPYSQRYEHVVFVEVLRQELLLRLLTEAQENSTNTEYLAVLKEMVQAIYRSA